MFAVRYELGFCIPEDGILHIHGRENIKSYYIRPGFQGRRDQNYSSIAEQRN
jgi:hypothetical protein